GLIGRAGAADTDEKPADDQFTSEEPLPEWERDLLEGNAAQAAGATGIPEADAAPAPTADETVAEVAATEVAEADAAAAAAEDAAEAEALDGDVVSEDSTTAEEVAEAKTETADTAE
ncbi:MAG TPA: hypothetical protein VMG13_25385, partial [Trebonia sp.]|nr:hypothetical protein [Trebonia sp.]